MFTVHFLQDDLAGELEGLFREERFPDNHGNMVRLNIFKQFLPVRDVLCSDESQEELENSLLDSEDLADEVLPVPYINVMLTDGEHDTRSRPGVVNVLFYIGIRDDGDKREGYQWVLHIIQKICERFSKNFCIGSYRCGEKIVWELSGLDEHPFYFGAAGMEFSTTSIVKEDKFC